jgi:hypothetical protein
MTYLESIILLTRNAVDTFFRNVHATPEELLTWKGSEKTRTIMEMVSEVHTTTSWNTKLIQDRTPAGEWNDAVETPSTLTEYEAVIRALFEEFYAVLAAFPQEELTTMVELPWGTMSLLDVIVYPYWNLNWHTGQIAYIQLLHGDGEMH